MDTLAASTCFELPIRLTLQTYLSASHTLKILRRVEAVFWDHSLLNLFMIAASNTLLCLPAVSDAPTPRALLSTTSLLLRLQQCIHSSVTFSFWLLHPISGSMTFWGPPTSEARGWVIFYIYNPFVG